MESPLGRVATVLVSPASQVRGLALATSLLQVSASGFAQGGAPEPVDTESVAAAHERCLSGFGPGEPSDAQGPRSFRASATFTLSGDGYDETVTYTEERNLVFCRRSGETMLWVRLGEQRADDGEQGGHIDIDLCNVSGHATFAAMNARGRPCPGGLTWGIWWHDGLDRVYADRADSSPCELVLEVRDGTLAEPFGCRGLATQGGGPTLDILDGSFLCDLDGGRLTAPSEP